MSIPKTKLAKANVWTTLESGWSPTIIKFGCRFQYPIGAKIRVRHGANRFLGWTTGQKMLDGSSYLLVCKASIVSGRVQIFVQQETYVEYSYVPTADL